MNINIYQIKIFSISFIITMIISLFAIFSVIAISNSQKLLHGNSYIQSYSNNVKKLNENEIQKEKIIEKISTSLYHVLPFEVKFNFQIFKTIYKTIRNIG